MSDKRYCCVHNSLNTEGQPNKIKTSQLDDFYFLSSVATRNQFRFLEECKPRWWKRINSLSLVYDDKVVLHSGEILTEVRSRDIYEPTTRQISIAEYLSTNASLAFSKLLEICGKVWHLTFSP